MQCEFPDWAAFTPAAVEAALPGLLDGAERGIAAIEAARPSRYEDFVYALEDAMRPLFDCWGGVGHMLSVMNDDAWRRLEETWQPKLVEFSLRVSQSKAMFETARAMLREPDAAGLSPVRRRILEKMVQSAELAGVGLADDAKARFNEIKARLAKVSSDFHNSVIDATKAFSFEKDGKVYTIDDAAYRETMKHCPDREVREALCRARATRAPENEPRIAETLSLRREMASLLGFPDYAAMSLSTKSAPSVAAVMAMIDELDAATREPADREEAALHDVAGDCQIEPWDREFFAERLRERTYAYSEDELKRHFRLDDVLSGLFRLAKALFGAEVVEVCGDDRPPTWHPDVRFFALKEDGETVAHFYLDPYVRSGQKSGGAWMNDFRRRYSANGRTVLPLAVVVTNFPQPDENGECFLPMREVETIFHEFGHALQAMLTRVNEEGASGLALVEWDAVEVASQFMENWCLDDRTGLSVPAELKAKVRAAKTFRAASVCRRQLAMDKTDLLLHVADFDGDATGVKRRVFEHFGIHAVEGDHFLCGFLHIFAGGYAAGYYGYHWAEVMSADCYGAFEEAGLGDDDTVRSVGAKFRETVLALGGSVSALEVFRKFRGRDPSPAALLRRMGLA